MQDRVVGPLTMVQFLYAIFGGGFAYIMLNTLPKPFSYFVATIIAIFTVCVIFVKINERPFLPFMASFLLFTTKPKVRVWSKSTHTFKVDVYQNPNQGKKTITKKNVSKDDLRKLSEILDR